MNLPICTVLFSFALVQAHAAGVIFNNPPDDMPGPGMCSPCSITPSPDYQVWDRLDLPGAAAIEAVQFGIDDLTDGGATHIRLGVARQPGGPLVYTRVFQRADWQNYDSPYPTTNRGIVIPMPRGLVLPAGTWYFTIFGEQGTRLGVRPSSVTTDRSMMVWNFAEQRWTASNMDAGLVLYGEFVTSLCARPPTWSSGVQQPGRCR